MQRTRGQRILANNLQTFFTGSLLRILGPFAFDFFGIPCCNSDMDLTEDSGAKSGVSASIFAYLAWFAALVGTVGSLFFSEVMDLPPCSLCWYQRIALYPLVFVIGVGIATADRSWRKYAWPLVLAGLAIAVYHNLLYYGFIAEELAPCTEGVPCNAKQLELLGFITIPLMSLAGFAAIAAAMLFDRPANKL